MPASVAAERLLVVAARTDGVAIAIPNNPRRDSARWREGKLVNGAAIEAQGMTLRFVASGEPL